MGKAGIVTNLHLKCPATCSLSIQHSFGLLFYRTTQGWWKILTSRKYDLRAFIQVRYRQTKDGIWVEGNGSLPMHILLTQRECQALQNRPCEGVLFAHTQHVTAGCMMGRHAFEGACYGSGFSVGILPGLLHARDKHSPGMDVIPITCVPRSQQNGSPVRKHV